MCSVCQGDQGAVGQEVWCQLACRRRRGIWLRDQLRGNAGNAIVLLNAKRHQNERRNLLSEKNWLRDQLQGNAGNAIGFTLMKNAIKLKEEFGGS
jgi:hypothetical protein